MDRKLLVTLSSELEAGRRVAYVVVVDTKGSAPRHSGSSMLLKADGGTEGTVGGGKGEAQALAAARSALARGESTIVEVEMLGAGVAGSDMICGGTSRMLVEILDNSSTLVSDIAAASRGEKLELVHPLPGGGEFRDPVSEFERLLVFGGGHVGLALARLARDLDFLVTVCDERPEFADPARFPPEVGTRCGPFAQVIADLRVEPSDWLIVMTPGHEKDLTCVRALVRAGARYLGFIGSARKTRLILEALKKEGNDPALVDAIRAPIGIDIGAETPAEIAVSILAELVAERRKADILESVVKDRARRRA